MSIRTGSPIRLAVIGLGRCWSDRFREAIGRRPDRFRVVALYDTIRQRAQTEAVRLGCHAASSMRALIDSPEIDAVGLLGSSWDRPVALRAALTAGKPCLISGTYRDVLPEFAAESAVARHSKPKIMLDLPGRFEASTMRLRELFATRLGRPRLLIGRFGCPRSTQSGPSNPAVDGPTDALLDLACDRLDWCRFLFQTDPHRVDVTTASWRSGEAANAMLVGLSFPGGAAASLQVLDMNSLPNIQADGVGSLGESEVLILTELGEIDVLGFDRLSWRDQETKQEEHLAHDALPEDVLLEHFYRLCNGMQSLAPSLDEMRALGSFLCDLEHRLISHQAT